MSARFVSGEWDWMKGLPPEYGPVMQDTSRQMKMADLLRQQSFDMPTGQMVSGHYVAPSITQYLAQTLKGWNANKMEEDAYNRQKSAFEEYKQKEDSANQRLADALRGKTVEQPVDYNDSGMPGMTEQVQQSPDYDAALMEYIQAGGNNPALIQLAQSKQENSRPIKVGNTLIDPVTYKPIYTDQANGADPYFTPIPTEQGLGKFDNRTGGFEIISGPNGQPIVKSTDSPTVRGAVKGAESRAAADYKPNTDIDGQILTDTQVTDMARGGLPTNNFNTPYPVTFGAPGTTATDIREGTGTEASVSVRNPSNPRGGISVPTAAEKAAEKKRAELVTEDRVKAQSGLGQVIAQGEETIKLVDDLLKHPGFGAAVGTSSVIDPRNYIPGTDAKDFNVRLDQLKGKQFLQAFETLKGGGQITEVEGRKATDAISRMNKAMSESEFKNAAKDFQDVIRAGMDRAKAKSGQLPAERNAVRRFNPSTGRIE